MQTTRPLKQRIPCARRRMMLVYSHDARRVRQMRGRLSTVPHRVSDAAWYSQGVTMTMLARPGVTYLTTSCDIPHVTHLTSLHHVTYLTTSCDIPHVTHLTSLHHVTYLTTSCDIRDYTMSTCHSSPTKCNLNSDGQSTCMPVLCSAL